MSASTHSTPNSEFRTPNSKVLDYFRQTGALLDGHFILRSGLHSRTFFQCALLLQHARIADEVCGLLANTVRQYDCETIISPALGGIIVGQEVARHLDKRHIFVEKDGQGGLIMCRGFEVKPGERVIVAEDVVTRGGRVQQTIDIARAMGAQVVAACAIVDRSGGHLPDFGCPFHSLIALSVETFDPHALPPDLQAIPAIKPGSK